MTFLPAEVVQAQAWTQPPGGAYLKAFYGKVDAAEQYAFDGQAVDFISGLPGDTFRDRSLYLYSETGLSKAVTLVLTVPYKRIFVRDQAYRFRTFAFGSVAIGARVSLLEVLGRQPSRNALAANLSANVPMGYKRNYAPSGGPGQVDLQAMVNYGRSFWPFPAYAQGGAGYRHRTSVFAFSGAVECQQGRDINCIGDVRPDFGDEVLFSAEVGGTPFGGALLVQGLVGGSWSVGAPSVGFSALNPIPTHQRFVKMGGGATVYPFEVLGMPALESIGVGLQYFLTTMGRNTINSRDLFVGIEFRTQL